MKAPFPYFGGKRSVVDLAWARIERAMCTGCELCAKACARGAIVPQ